MKIQDTPRSGKCGAVVAFQSRYGLCLRELVIPRNTKTEARQFMRAAFGYHSHAFSHSLSEEQQDRWRLAGAQVSSDPRLGTSGPLTGQQFYESINSVRSRVGSSEALEPPLRPAFGPNPVAGLVITNDASGIRLFLSLTGDPGTDIMVFAQAPCSRGRTRRRNVAYIGLTPPAVNGLSEITYLYKARFGEPRPGTKVFVVTCQEHNGWKSTDRVDSRTVPEPPEQTQAPATLSTPSSPAMHKGSSPAAQGLHKPVPGQSQAGGEPAAGGKGRENTSAQSDGGLSAGGGGSG